MSNNKEDTPSEEISSRQPEPNVTREEASAKLEEHRCAICDNVLINACRIGCGHTFCRHCLSLQKETRNERGKPTCFICDAAVIEICHNNARDKEINGLYALLSVDAQLSRARAKAERKAEEEDFEEKMKNGEYQHPGAGSNESSGNGDASDQAAMNDDGWEEGYPDNQDVPEPLTFYLEQDPYSFWQANEENGLNEAREYHEHNDYEAETSNDDDLEEESQSGGPNLLYQQPQQVPIVVRHTVQHIFQTVEVQNSTTYNGSEDQVGRHRRDQLRHSCYAENSFTGESSNMSNRLDASTCRRAQRSDSSRSPFLNPNCSGHCYHNSSPTNISSGYYPCYTTRHAVPNVHYPNMPSNSHFLSPMTTPLSSFCYRGYPPHPTSHLLYASPSPHAVDRYSDFDENRNEFHRVPSNHSWESVSEYHGAVPDELSTSPRSSRDFIHFVEEETDGEQDDDHMYVLQEGENYESDTQSESDGQTPHRERITVNLTIPIPDNITVRRRECTHRHRRPSTCSGYIFELE